MSVVSPIEIPTELARVWNNSDKEYVERFKNDIIKIPAHGYIEMDFHDAVLFKGQYIPPNEGKNQKRITVEKIMRADPNWRPSGFISHIDGKVFATQEELDAHLKANNDKYIPVKNPKLDEQLNAQGSILEKLADTLFAIDERLKKLEAKPATGTGKPRGRPKRDTTGNHTSSEGLHQ